MLGHCICVHTTPWQTREIRPQKIILLRTQRFSEVDSGSQRPLKVLRRFSKCVKRFSEVSNPSCYTVQLCLNPKSVLEFHKSKCNDMTVKVIFSSSAALPQRSWRRERRRRSKKNWESASRHREINQSAAFVIECVCVFLWEMEDDFPLFIKRWAIDESCISSFWWEICQ